MKKTLTLFLLLAIISAGYAQDEGIKYQDHVYLNNIKSVKFHLNGAELSYPIIELQSNGQLVLTFDDMEDEVKDYIYTFVHCDYNWKPSKDISDMDYIDGFTEEDIDDYDFSFNTVTNFTNYRLRLPNEDIRWTKSGNYILKVYDNTNEKTLAITRRIMVVDPRIRVLPSISYPSNVSKGRSHHEIDFRIAHKGFEIRNPQVEINIAVLQNGRWDNAVKDLKPLFVKPEEIIYDYQDKITFPAGKEFRFADLRSLRYKTQSMFELFELKDGYEVTLFQDKSRIDKGYLSDPDINGHFIIESLDDNDANLRSDYCEALFSLKESPAYQGADVYIYGGLTDWEIKDEFKMTYNDIVSSYVAKVFLKQGYYDYIYALVDRKDKSINTDELEGNWHETENNYTILIYYTPFGARYDQIIGAVTINPGR